MRNRRVHAGAPRGATSAATVAHSSSAARARTLYNSSEEQLAALRLEFADVYRELYEAAQMQRKVSGPRILRRGDFEIAAEIFPVRHLSGDFFNVSDSGPTTLLAVGDIAGKGLMAGMWFTHMLGLTRMFAESIADPGKALAAMNRQMCQAISPPPLTSLFLARLNWASGELVYSNAGHPAPLVLRSGNAVESLATGGPVLGAVPSATFDSATAHLDPGDRLIGFSDGLLECANENFEEFGVERVIDEVRRVESESSASELLFSIIGAAQDFAGTQARTDDCTLMVVRHTGK
jgi:serine phosphatase RsbU (regulator of sigma subunit)